jgi:hypothetical protein
MMKRGRHLLPTLDRHPCAHQTHTNVASPTNGPPESPAVSLSLAPVISTGRPHPPSGRSWRCLGNRPRRPARHRVWGACACVGEYVLFVVAKQAKRWRLPACFTAGQQKQPAPVEAMRPREADSSRDSSRALMAVSARRSSSALDTGDVDHHGTAQQGWLTYIRIAQFSLQCGRRDCRCSLVDRSFARSRTVSARLLGLAFPNTLPS